MPPIDLECYPVIVLVVEILDSIPETDLTVGTTNECD